MRKNAEEVHKIVSEYAEEVQKMVSEFINNMSFEPTESGELMSKDHRTLQPAFSNLCLTWIKKQADNYNKGNYDGRNAHSCKICAEIVEKVEHLSFIRISDEP